MSLSHFLYLYKCHLRLVRVPIPQHTSRVCMPEGSSLLGVCDSEVACASSSFEGWWAGPLRFAYTGGNFLFVFGCISVQNWSDEW